MDAQVPGQPMYSISFNSSLMEDKKQGFAQEKTINTDKHNWNVAHLSISGSALCEQSCPLAV